MKVYLDFLEEDRNRIVENLYEGGKSLPSGPLNSIEDQRNAATQ